jgi:hypothetical protein
MNELMPHGSVISVNKKAVWNVIWDFLFYLRTAKKPVSERVLSVLYFMIWLG